MNIKSFSDPAIFGPGLWYKIHSDSIACNTLALKESFVININALCNHFKCIHCKVHFRKFIDTHPLQNYFNIMSNNRDIGIFQWSWELHNDVNGRLGKPKPTLEQAYAFYKLIPSQPCKTCNMHK